MLPKYKVTALKMGALTVDKSTLTLGRDFGQEIDIPIWAAAIEGDGRRMVVDTGIRDRDWVDREVSPCAQAPDETITGSLAKMGWDPAEVDTVINTHLHYDHCGGNASFPNARFYVSPVEWEYAQDPIITQKIFYDRAFWNDNTDYFSFVFTGDNYDVCPGVRILATPGHTPGHQSVLVNTAEGIVAITGDALNLPENLIEGVVPGILHTAPAALRSIKRIKTYADFVITGHDPSLKSHQTGSFPSTK